MLDNFTRKLFIKSKDAAYACLHASRPYDNTKHIYCSHYVTFSDNDSKLTISAVFLFLKSYFPIAFRQFSSQWLCETVTTDLRSFCIKTEPKDRMS